MLVLVNIESDKKPAVVLGNAAVCMRADVCCGYVAE